MPLSGIYSVDPQIKYFGDSKEGITFVINSHIKQTYANIKNITADDIPLLSSLALASRRRMDS